MSIDALGNLDIWTDILQYFKISLEFDSESEVKEKRKCLFHIALLSPSLTAPALDLLWQDMTSLVPATQVINVNSDLDSSVVLRFSEDHGGFWTLTEPIISNKVHERAYAYLTRIRHLRLQIGSSKDMGAGSILSMALCANPLLPRLKSFDLDFSQWNGVQTWTYAIGILISPSLTSISYYAATVAQIEGIRTLQSLFYSQVLALSSIVYRGHLSPMFLRTCVQFQNLEVLKLSNKPSNSPVQRSTSGVSIATVFEKLQNLVDLEIDLRLLPFLGETTRTITASPLLQKLSIACNSPDIGEFLQVKSSSLHSLTVVMFEPPNLPWKATCDTLAINFPQLHSLSFRRAISQGFQQMLPQDLSSFISRPTMRSLKLHGISHCFTEAYICGFLGSWPDLRTLSITDDYTIHFSASLLIQLSRADHLRIIELPLELKFLEDRLPDEAIPLAHSHLTELTITSLASPPPSLERKIKVAKNLLTLFPLLERIITHSTSSPLESYLMELEELLRAFRSAIVTYLQRKETERRLRTKKETA